MDQDKDKHWLVRRDTIRKLWIAFGVILALTVIPDFFIEQHAHFGIDGSFAFYAWYGFLTCVGFVLFAKLLGLFLKRDESYYDD